MECGNNSALREFVTVISVTFFRVVFLGGAFALVFGVASFSKFLVSER